jgi:hypothetical protein
VWVGGLVPPPLVARGGPNEGVAIETPFPFLSKKEDRGGPLQQS